MSFKELKQHFGFGKCQSRDFVGQIADATISLITYNTLAKHQSTNDYQTIGGLFAEVSREWIKPNIMVRFWRAFEATIIRLAQILKKDVQLLLDKVIHDNAFFYTLKQITLKISPET